MSSSPTLACSRWCSSSRASGARLFSPVWPAARNWSRHWEARAAVIPNSRDTDSRFSPRSRRSTVARLRRAENRPFRSRSAAGLVALRALSAAVDSSTCFLISTLLLRELSRNQVSKKTLGRRTGRKSDVSDCQWIQRLHPFGLLRGSFRPTAEITAIRTLLRHRDTLMEGAAACIQRMQKALPLMNRQLHTVISDVTGVTGMLILRDIVAGVTDPTVLARHRDPRCKASEAEIAASLTGHSRAEHLFVLLQELEVYDCYHETIQRGDEQIEARVHALQAQCEPPGRDLPASRKPSPKSKRQDNTPSFEIRSPLFTLCDGVDLTALPGLGPYGALRLISEIGVDMRCWPTEHHFASWLTLAPNNKISGGSCSGLARSRPRIEPPRSSASRPWPSFGATTRSGRSTSGWPLAQTSPPP